MGGVLEAAGAVFDDFEAVASGRAAGSEGGRDCPGVGLGVVVGVVLDAGDGDAVG